MRRAALLLAVLAPAGLAATAPEAGARTTRLTAYSTLSHHPQGYFRRGEDVRVIARTFIPPPLCRARVRIRLRDSAGHDFTLGRFRPRFGPPLGLLARRVGTVPAGAAFGRGTIRSRQSCNVGTASGSDGIVIVDPSQPAPVVTPVSATGAESGSVTRVRFRIDRRALITVAVDFELVPGVWREVEIAREEGLYKDPGTFAVDWRASVGGLVPAGSYRFRIVPRAVAAGLGTAVAIPFIVRPKTRPPKPGTEPTAAGAVAAGLRPAT